MKVKINYWGCGCEEGKAYADGTMPEYFTDKLKAIKRFCSYCMFGWGLYGGVHLNGKHVAGVNIEETVYGTMSPTYITNYSSKSNDIIESRR